MLTDLLTVIYIYINFFKACFIQKVLCYNSNSVPAGDKIHACLYRDGLEQNTKQVVSTYSCTAKCLSKFKLLTDYKVSVS